MEYLYENHLGGLYITEEEVPFEDLYCEECEDSDHLIGQFWDVSSFWDLIKDDCDLDGQSGGYSLQYIYPIIVNEFNLPYEVTYANNYELEEGFCNNTNTDILANINQAIEQSNEGGRGKCMTNYDFIKSMNINQMAKFLDSLGFDETPWTEWFLHKYCDHCETIIGKYDGNEREFAYCGFEHKCRFFDDDTWSDSVKSVKLWLEANKENC